MTHWHEARFRTWTYKMCINWCLRDLKIYSIESVTQTGRTEIIMHTFNKLIGERTWKAVLSLTREQRASFSDSVECEQRHVSDFSVLRTGCGATLFLEPFSTFRGAGLKT